MAIAKVADRGSLAGISAGAASAAVDMAAAASITTGNYLIAHIMTNNSGTAGAAVAVTVSDARSGSWNVGSNNYTPTATVNDGATATIAYVKASAAYTNGDDVTVSFSPNCTGWAIVIDEWSGLASSSPLISYLNVASGSSGTPSCSVTGITASGQLVYGCLAKEGGGADTYTEDADTLDGTWVSLTGVDNGNATAAGVQVRGAYKLVTGTNNQTWNPTMTSRDWSQIVFVFTGGIARDMAAKAASSWSIKGPYVVARKGIAKVGAASSSKSAAFKRAAKVVTKVSTASSAKAVLKTTRTYAAKVAAGNSAKAIVGVPKRFAGKFPQSDQAKAVLQVGRLQTFAAKIGGSDSAKATTIGIHGHVSFTVVVSESHRTGLRRVVMAQAGQTRTLQSPKVSISSKAKAIFKSSRQGFAKIPSASKAKAALSFSKRYVTKAATSSKAKAVLSTTSTAQGNPPAIPANITTGPYASDMLAWGGGNYIYFTDAEHTLYHSWGFKSSIARVGWLYGLGHNNALKGSTAIGSAGSQWTFQQQLENGGFVSKIHARGSKAYLQGRFSCNWNKYPGATGKTWSPFNNWFDNSFWDNVILPAFANWAAAGNFLGFDGLAGDFEAYQHIDPLSFPGNPSEIAGGAWFKPPPGTTGLTSDDINHTQAEYEYYVHLRGYQVGQAVWSNFPNAHFIFYYPVIPHAWLDVVICGNIGQNPDNPDNFETALYSQFLEGFCAAMAAAGATGSIHYMDSTYYKGNQGGPLNASFGNSWILNSQRHREWLSTRWPQSTTDYIMSRFYISPFTWISMENGDRVKFSRDRGEGSVGQLLADSKEWGEKGVFADYLWEGSPDLYLSSASWVNPQAPYGQNWYTKSDTNPPGNHLPGMQSATTNQTHTMQGSGNFIIGTIGQSRSGNTVTLTFTAKYPVYSMKNVHWKLYASNGTSILGQGEANMLWNQAGGHFDTNYNNEFMNCTVTIPNAISGLYVILDFYSTKETRTSRRVQLV